MSFLYILVPVIYTHISLNYPNIVSTTPVKFMKSCERFAWKSNNTKHLFDTDYLRKQRIPCTIHEDHKDKSSPFVPVM